jgi:hypothetical protein
MTARRQPQPKRSKPWLLTWTEGRYGLYSSHTGEPRHKRRHFEFGEDALDRETKLIAQGYHPTLKLEGLDKLNLDMIVLLPEIKGTPLGEMVRRLLAQRSEEDK